MEKEFKRMRYFDGLALNADDYSLDKNLQIRLQGLHNRYLHTFGIVHGLEVKSVIDNSMEVYVTDGIALDLVDFKDQQGELTESLSRQILIYNGHPDNPIDLSEYSGGENIYISVSYDEVLADCNIERGQGEEIHLWERGRIKHSKVKPSNCNKNIILARVVPRIPTKEERKVSKDADSIIDSTCIFDTDVDGSSLRVYAGISAEVMKLSKFIFALEENNKNMPYIKSYDDKSIIDNEEECDEYCQYSEDGKEDYEYYEETEYTSRELHKGITLEVKSPSTIFTGSVNVNGNMILKSDVAWKSMNKNTSELNIIENYLKLNSTDKDDDKRKVRDGGLEVYRGCKAGRADARVTWSEEDKVWKIGTGNELYNLGGGPLWERLIEKKSCVDLHQHRSIYSTKGNLAMYFEDNGNLSLNTDLIIKDKGIVSSDINGKWGVGLTRNREIFNNGKFEVPALYGLLGGILGATEGGEKSVLSWNHLGNVGIGKNYPVEDMLDVDGSLCLLGGSNPIKFTSSWSGFPDSTVNRAEISNDTDNYRELMIVGNQSSGQGRKVAIWDRLDVTGLLYTNGNTHIINVLTPSSGNLNNGIIFSSDPGGGWGDSAWIKYYPLNGEDCSLEIGTANDSDDNISFMPSGSLGIGKASLTDKLAVMGNTRIMSSKNPLIFTSQWSGFTDKVLNQAEISNDVRDKNRLIISGNKSSGQGRRVSIWDNLDVKESLLVSGNFQVNGAIIPGVGKEESKGIIFPKDPCGGSGDNAWIRYFSDPKRGGRENMTLEIGIANDSNIEEVTDRYWKSYCSWCSSPNNNRYGCGHWEYVKKTIMGTGGDRLRLFASGGVYIEGGFYYTSSREYKDNIYKLCSESLQDALEGLQPVEFNFKGDHRKRTMGFIAEDVDDRFTAQDKKAINPLEIITVLVSEVKEQENSINKLKNKFKILKNRGNN